MTDIFWMFIGGGATIAAYVLYVGATKGAPAAWSMLKAWWTSAKTEAAVLKNDVANAHSRLTALETDVMALKGKVGL